jgi:hypothetical protein
MRVGQRFESARRLSHIGLYKPNTRGQRKPQTHCRGLFDSTELLTAFRSGQVNVFFAEVSKIEKVLRRAVVLLGVCLAGRQ